MPSTTAIIAFAALSAAIIAVPGPSVTFIVGRAIAHGRRTALLTVLGNTVGAYCQIVVVALGLGAVLQRSVAVFTVVKLVGAGYLVYLGVRAVRERAHPDEVDGEAAPPSARTRRVVTDGWIVGVANPKLAVFMVAILPQYVDAAGASPIVQMLVLGLVFAAIAAVLDSGWALAAGTARRWLARSPRARQRFGLVGGLTMIGLGVQVAVSGRAD